MPLVMDLARRKERFCFVDMRDSSRPSSCGVRVRPTTDWMGSLAEMALSTDLSAAFRSFPVDIW